MKVEVNSVLGSAGLTSAGGGVAAAQDRAGFFSPVKGDLILDILVLVRKKHHWEDHRACNKTGMRGVYCGLYPC